MLIHLDSYKLCPLLFSPLKIIFTVTGNLKCFLQDLVFGIGLALHEYKIKLNQTQIFSYKVIAPRFIRFSTAFANL